MKEFNNCVTITVRRCGLLVGARRKVTGVDLELETRLMRAQDGHPFWGCTSILDIMCHDLIGSLNCTLPECHSVAHHTAWYGCIVSVVYIFCRLVGAGPQGAPMARP